MDSHQKGMPIAFRPEKDDEERLLEIVHKARITRSDLARRALRHVLEKIEHDGSVSFLFTTETAA